MKKKVIIGIAALLALFGLAAASSHPTIQTTVPVAIPVAQQASKPTDPAPTPTTSPSTTPAPAPAVASPPAASNTGTTDTNLSNSNTYTNVDGNVVHSPANSTDGQVPAGATAQCGDGTYSFSQHRSGTCSYHGGVSQWLN